MRKVVHKANLTNSEVVLRMLHTEMTNLSNQISSLVESIDRLSDRRSQLLSTRKDRLNARKRQREEYTHILDRYTDLKRERDDTIAAYNHDLAIIKSDLDEKRLTLQNLHSQASELLAESNKLKSLIADARQQRDVAKNRYHEVKAYYRQTSRKIDQQQAKGPLLHAIASDIKHLDSSNKLKYLNSVYESSDNTNL